MVTLPFTRDPSVGVAVITALPRFRPFTFPFASTLAICGFLLSHTTPLMDASAGSHSAVSGSIAPLSTAVVSVWITTAFTGWVTSTRKVSVISGLSVLATVSVHSPRWMAFSALLLTTLATPSSSVVNVTCLLLASVGVHTADRLTVAPAATAITRYSVASRSSPAIVGSSGSYTASPFVLSVTFVTGRITFTLIWALPTRFPLRIRFAYTTASPLVTAVIVPSPLTEAIPGLLLV